MTGPIIDGGNAYSTYSTPSGATPPALAGGVFSPDITTYATRTPYITAAEFTEAGTGCDVSQLVPGGDTAANRAALTRVIGRASAWADSLTYKVLGATLDIEAGFYRVRGGVCTVPVAFAPVIEVVAISTGDYAWSMTALSSLAQVAIVSPKLVQFAVGGCWSGRRFVSLSYVNGWTCTTLAGSTAIGDTSLNLSSVLGVYPGQVLTVDDGGGTETVVVDYSYTPGATGPVPLAAPVTGAHAAGVAASAMPQDIKQAVILLTAALIKTRGNESYTMAALGAQPTTTATQAGGTSDVADAMALLKPYKRAA